MLTWEQFRNDLTLLLASFPKLDPSHETIQAWFALLRDLRPDAWQRAVVAFCQSQAEVYPGTNIVATLRGLALPETAPASWAAWAEVRQEMQELGPYERPSFSHPRIASVVDALGWRRLCESEDSAIDRAHFIKAYEQAGQTDRTARLVSHSVPQPIGNFLGSAA